MPPRIPAANELIADKRCYTWHDVLRHPTHPPPSCCCQARPARGGAQPRPHSQDPVLTGAPKVRAKRGWVYWGQGPNFASWTPQGRTRLALDNRTGEPWRRVWLNHMDVGAEPYSGWSLW